MFFYGIGFKGKHIFTSKYFYVFQTNVSELFTVIYVSKNTTDKKFKHEHEWKNTIGMFAVNGRNVETSSVSAGTCL